MPNIIDSILKEDSIRALLSESERAYVLESLGFSDDFKQNKNELARLIFFFINAIFSNDNDQIQDLPSITYKLIKSIDVHIEEDKNSFKEVFGLEGINDEILYYFYLSNVALLADKTINIRIDLKRFSEPSLHTHKGRKFNRSFFLLLNIILKSIC